MYSILSTIVILVAAAVMLYDFSNEALSTIFSTLGLLFIIANIWAPISGVLILMAIMFGLYHGILAHIDRTYGEFTSALKKVVGAKKDDL